MSQITCSNRLAPWRDSETLTDFIGRAFDHAVATSAFQGPGWIPAASVQEFDNEILLDIELPGVSEESVEIAVENHILAISGEKLAETQTESEGNEGKHHIQERVFGAFRRTFRLPNTVRADAISAEMENGLLTVRIPKAEEARARKIEVTRRASA